MTKRRKRIVIGSIVLVPLLALFVLWAFVDSPAPDDADLRLAYERIPDEENAFTYLDQAVAALDWPEEYYEKKRVEDLLLEDGWDDALAADIVGRNESLFEMLDQALACPRFQVPEINSFDTHLPYLAPWRAIARLGAIRAELLFRQGREKEAFDQALQVVHFGDRIHDCRSSLVGWLVGNAVEVAGLKQLREMLGRTHLDAATLRAYIPQLAACSAAEPGLGNVLRIEYIMAANTVDGLASGRPSTSDFMDDRLWVRLSPLKSNKTKAMLAASFRILVANASKTRAEAALIPQMPPYSTSFVLKAIASGNGKGIALYTLLMPGFGRAHAQKCAMNSSLASTQVLIALRCYQLEHGELPDALEALVPGTLEALPLDDFDGKPIKWSQAERTIYTVGPDLRDNGGVAADDREGVLPEAGYDLIFKIGF